MEEIIAAIFSFIIEFLVNVIGEILFYIIWKILFEPLCYYTGYLFLITISLSQLKIEPLYIDKSEYTPTPSMHNSKHYKGRKGYISGSIATLVGMLFWLLVIVGIVLRWS